MTEDDILITNELFRRSPKQLKSEAEHQVLQSLGQLAKSPQLILKHFAQIAKDSCQAGTAGISLIESTSNGEEVFRWAALSGTYEPFEGTTTPRHFSLCTLCLESGSAQLYAQPERHFTYLQTVTPAAVETLVLPLMLEERPFGTLWIVTHDPQRSFDREHVRVLTSLADSLAVALSGAEARQAAEALRQNEARLLLALVVGQMGSWDWDIQTDSVDWTEGHYTLLGLQPGEVEPSYQVWSRSVHPEDRAEAEAALQQAMAAQEVEYHHEYRTVWPDGSIHWTEVRGQFFYNADGQPCRMIGVMLNISPRKQAEAEREQLLAREQAAREQAETANRIKDEFLAVLSHELRTPLNPILGWSSLLRKGRLNAAKTALALETIERNAKLQIQLIEDLLDVSRILSGKLSLNKSPINLAPIVEAALETMRLAAEAKSIQIEMTVEPVGQVLGDAARLQQVVWNLLSNAIKFTPEGGRVQVRLERASSDLTDLCNPTQNSVQITVTDTGAGISPEFLLHVFEYFRQADSTTTRRFGGLGLGLAIVHHLVELHGGTVQAESLGEGQGATFTVKLPLLGSRELGVGDQQDYPDSGSTLDASLTDVQILLVDDEADTRSLITFTLEESGAIVTPAASAIEALQAIIQAQPDVLISDIGLPNIDGYTLMRQIRAMPQGQQILAIALTAYAGEADRQQAIDAGFQRHLAKPVEPEELIRTVVSLIRWDGIGDRV